MAKKPVKDKEPIIWGRLDWSYRETGTGNFGSRPCGGLFVFQNIMQIIYIFTAIILVLTGGVSGWLISNNQKDAHQVTEINIQEPVVATSTKTIDEEIKKIEPQPSATVEVEDTSLKIAKCKATKESSYNQEVSELEESTQIRLKEVFNSLDEQYKVAVNKLYASVDIQKSRIRNDDSLTGTAKLSLIEQYNQEASTKAEELYENQQTFWQNQKQEIEDAKKTGINEINISLDAEYTSCLQR